MLAISEGCSMDLTEGKNMGTKPRIIIIAGGTGYLGRALAASFVACGDRVMILTRTPQPAQQSITFLPWDGQSRGAWYDALNGATAIINLAGRSVNCRYSAINRQAIYDSRLNSTRILGEAILACDQPPPVWLNASSATIYRHALDRPMDELTGDLGTGFSVDVCQRWEAAFFTSQTPQMRKVALRAAMVFGPGSGGVMDAFRNMVRCGLGGTMGNGQQFVSWIHLDDFVSSIDWLIEHETMEGPVNLAAPNPRTNADFMQILRLVCQQPLGLPATRWMLEVGAFFLRTETELLLKSRRVIPTRLLEAGFQFRYPDWYHAAESIMQA